MPPGTLARSSASRGAAAPDGRRPRSSAHAGGSEASGAAGRVGTHAQASLSGRVVCVDEIGVALEGTTTLKRRASLVQVQTQNELDAKRGERRRRSSGREHGAEVMMTILSHSRSSDASKHGMTKSSLAKQKVWVPSTPDKVFEMGYVDGMYETRAVRRTTNVKTISGNSLQAKVVLPANSSTLNDITKLLHINEATVLHNIEARSLEGKPCTWMGPVLMCVNPLQQTEEPESGDPTISRDVPHPYSLAEEVVSQMQFFRNHGDLRSQSIVISGESGSGKTVSAKKILDHFIKRLYIPEWGETQNSDEKDVSLDVKLLETNPILEAFGNAVTLRNGNSSRFGKFFRLHIDDDGFIIGASLDTYLLERSRVSSHVAGERTFHVFYQLLKGCEPNLRAELQLDSEISSYRYLQNHPDAGTDAFTSPCSAASFQRLCTAFRRVQLEDEEVKNIFRLLAGIMHLGNVEFIAWRSDDESKATRGSAPALANAATLWGLSSPDHLEDLFCEKTIYIGPEKAKITLSAQDAGKARDAIAKEVYSLLFNWICSRINVSIKPEKSMAADWNILTGVSIGVLDIFGFESYERNDYEQLLINFANEKLHHLFTVHILQSEADLYLREGLTYASLLWDKQNFAHKPTSLQYNTDSIDLVRGIMQLIDEESRRLNASELNLNSSIQEKYKNSTKMKPVHPRKRQTCFTVIHFAGSVTYTVGNFLEKNDDSLPKETTTVLSNADNVLMPLIFEPRRISHRGGERGSVIRNKNSVAKKFATQMNDLIDTLDATNCSFVRCIKPNPKMRRNGAEEWFDRRYVMFQLKSLGITHAALTLRDGMPLRLAHEEAIDMFDGVFNVQGVESTFMTHGESSKARFVDAAMFAFDINRLHYRVGASLVFFDVECVELVERAMFDAKTWGKNPDSKDARAWSIKFSKFLIQRRWKRAVLAIQFALRLSLCGRNFRPAVVAIQRNVRRMLAVNTYKRYRKAALICQKYFRGAKGRAKAIFMIDLASKRAAAEEAALVRQKALEASLAAEAALRKAVEEIKAKALAREKEEEERARKEEEEMQAEKQREEEKRAKAEEEMQQRIERARETERAAMEETAARVRAKARAKAKIREKAARARRAARARAAEKRAQRAKEAEENDVMKVTKAAEEESKAKLKRLAEAEDEASRVEATRRPSAYERVRKKSIVVLDERKFEEAIDRVIQREEEREDKVAASYRETEITLGVQSQDSEILEQGTSSLSTSKTRPSASSVSSAKARETEDTDSIQTKSTKKERKRKRKKLKKKKVKPVTLATIACKLAVKSQSNWKERYFVLNTEGLYINYYVQHRGKPMPKKSVKFQINPPDYNPPPRILYSHEEIQLSNLKAVFEDGKIPGLQSKFVRMVTKSRIPGRFFLKIEGGVLDNDPLREIRSLYIAFDRFQDMKQWREAIQDALDQAPQDLYKNGPDISDHHSIVSFGEQVRCKNFRCSALNNTLYGKLCLECGSYLFESPSPSI